MVGTVHARGLQPTGSSRAAASVVVAARLILLLLAGVATVSAFVLSREEDQGAGAAAKQYVCPMHLEVVSSTPGSCPVCRMALERVRTPRQGEPAASSVADDPPAESASAPVTFAATRRSLSLEVRAPAWIEKRGQVTALLYDDEAAAPSERGLFFTAAAPARGIPARRAAEAPARWDGSTSRAAFLLEEGAPDIPPGEVGWLTLAARPRERLVVPIGAVLYSAAGPYVLAAGPDGVTLRVRRVEVGRTYRGLAVVLSGLREGERVVAANAFFLDAERRLQSLRQETRGAPTGAVTQ